MEILFPDGKKNPETFFLIIEAIFSLQGKIINFFKEKDPGSKKKYLVHTTYIVFWSAYTLEAILSKLIMNRPDISILVGRLNVIGYGPNQRTNQSR